MGESGEPDGVSDEDMESRFRLLTKRVEADDALMAIVSHDINSAVSSTAGLLALLLGANSDNLTRRQRNIIETLKRSATNQQELIENITTISRLQRGRLKLDLSILETNKLLKDAYEKFRGMADEKKVELVIAEGEGALINADSDLALMALSKIVTNAIWFTPPGDKVELSTKTSGSEAVLVVTDTGAGIEPKRLRDIFDLSKREYTLGARDEKGAGLGLYLARELMKLLVGALEIESKPGKGTSVRMIYPAQGANL
ncbi:hypothetical protein MNBD_NITROSPINAE04-2786 [hydrothermal vent metagenome]|uniref:histidine kinase n=1 Tax=hydrothermal vent metagenome TaxID=652676 RepID=A0A3B1C5Y1_9ZZZZ